MLHGFVGSASTSTSTKIFLVGTVGISFAKEVITVLIEPDHATTTGHGLQVSSHRMIKLLESKNVDFSFRFHLSDHLESWNEILVAGE